MIFDPFQLEFQRAALSKILEKLMTRAIGLEIHAAILDHRGDLILAGGPNPLHYPAFESCVKSMVKYIVPKNGETMITNDPYSGNTRFCDLLLMHGVYGRTQANELRYYVCAQVSFPQLLNKGLSKLPTSIEDEGFRIPPALLDHGLQVNPEIVQYLSLSGINNQELTTALERTKGALKMAAAELTGLEQKIGRDVFVKNLNELNKYSESLFRRALHELPDGEYSAHDSLDNDGVNNAPLRINCTLTTQGENILVNFTGSSKQTAGPFNCNNVLTLGAVFWTLRGLLKTDIPVNSGAFRAFSIEAPEGSLINAKYPAPMLGGYYETTKRVVDVLLALLNKVLPTQIPSQNGGTSSVVVMNFENKVHVEVLGTGSGANKDLNGTDSIMADLHNISVSSVEALESQFPIHVTHTSIRESSGGDGKHDGGNGVSRGYKFLAPGKLMSLADRRISKARGFFNGVSGLAQEVVLTKTGEKPKKLERKEVFEVNAGDILALNTSGGGGWGKKEEEPVDDESSSLD